MLQHKKDWVSVEDIFCVLSEYDIYVVLTGDEFLNRKFVGLGPHHDIDILTVNQRRTAQLLGAEKYNRYSDEHYRVKICGKKMTIGIYELGDDYMDSRWQKEMLHSRILHASGHYVMDSQNHFFWMLYHVLCQKRSIPEHYRIRIAKEADMLGITADTDAQMWYVLESFLIEKGYSCPYPKVFMEQIYASGFQIIHPSGYERWKMERIRKLPVRIVRHIYRRYLRRKYG